MRVGLRFLFLKNKTLYKFSTVLEHAVQFYEDFGDAGTFMKLAAREMTRKIMIRYEITVGNSSKEKVKTSTLKNEHLVKIACNALM